MVSGGPSKYLHWLRRDNFTTFTSKYLCWLAETILQHRAKFTTKSKSEVFYMKSKGRHQKQIRHCHGEFWSPQLCWPHHASSISSILTWRKIINIAKYLSFCRIFAGIHVTNARCICPLYCSTHHNTIDEIYGTFMTK